MLKVLFNLIKVSFFFILSIVFFGCQDTNDVSCKGAIPVTFSNDSIFINTSQNPSVVSGSGNVLALSCHNCYQNDNAFLPKSLSKIDSAINASADLIELDLVFDNQANEFRVSHEKESDGVLFTQIISQPMLVNTTELLFIELKQKITELSKIRSLFNSLKLHVNSTGQYAYLNQNRFVTIRHMQDSQTLSRFRNVLAEREFADIRDFVKLSRLYYKKEETQIFNEIVNAHQCGFHMIELEVGLGIEVILRLNAFAENLGLAVNVFTIINTNVDNTVSALKHDIDILTIEDSSTESITEESLISYVKKLLNET
jgi:hypothetical protein